MAKNESKKEIKRDHTGLFIPAGIFLGLGIGLLLGNAGAGFLIGLGLGFLAMAIAKLIK
ncbi:MAG: hypothetical protein ACOYT4_03940 [Nanoarchaeota archaeon]